jgi:hypothetical protein
LPIKPLLNVKREIWINEESLYGITVMIAEENKKYITLLLKTESQSRIYN